MLLEQNAHVQNQMAESSTINHADAIKQMSHLIHLNEQSERGFEVAAQHVRNRGLKIMLKTYAQQHREFARALRAQFEDEATIKDASPVQSVLASLHRGWIDVRAAMVIGRAGTEQMVVNEARRIEEQVVLKAYRKAISTHSTGPLGSILNEQFQQITDIHKQLEEIAGHHDERLLVQLFDSEEQAEETISQLHRRGIADAKIAVKPVQDVIQYYEANERMIRVKEGFGTGVILGTSLGLILGIVLGLITQIGASTAVANSVVTGMGLVGAFFGFISGGLFGAVVGYSTTEEDRYDYRAMQQTDGVLVLAAVNNTQSTSVRSFLRQQRWQLASAPTMS